MDKEITDRETFDGKDSLLPRKEQLLQFQWKLDKRKKKYERQLLNIEKVMEPIEIQIARKRTETRSLQK